MLRKGLALASLALGLGMANAATAGDYNGKGEGSTVHGGDFRSLEAETHFSAIVCK